MRSQAVREESESACSFWDRDVHACICVCAHACMHSPSSSAVVQAGMNNSKTTAPNSGWTRRLHKETRHQISSAHAQHLCLNILFQATRRRALGGAERIRQQKKNATEMAEQMWCTLGKWLSMHMCVMYCGLLALSKAERQAMTIKSMLEALSCEEEPHRSKRELGRKGRKKKQLVRMESLQCNKK